MLLLLKHAAFSLRCNPCIALIKSDSETRDGQHGIPRVHTGSGVDEWRLGSLHRGLTSRGSDLASSMAKDAMLSGAGSPSRRPLPGISTGHTWMLAGSMFAHLYINARVGRECAVSHSSNAITFQRQPQAPVCKHILAVHFSSRIQRLRLISNSKEAMMRALVNNHQKVIQSHEQAFSVHLATWSRYLTRGCAPAEDILRDASGIRQAEEAHADAAGGWCHPASSCCGSCWSQKQRPRACHCAWAGLLWSLGHDLSHNALDCSAFWIVNKGGYFHACRLLYVKGTMYETLYLSVRCEACKASLHFIAHQAS